MMIFDVFFGSTVYCFLERYGLRCSVIGDRVDSEWVGKRGRHRACLSVCPPFDLLVKASFVGSVTEFISSLRSRRWERGSCDDIWEHHSCFRGTNIVSWWWGGVCCLHVPSPSVAFVVVCCGSKGKRSSVSIGCALVCLTSSVLRNYCSFSGLCYLLWIWQARRAFFLSCLQVLIVLVVIYLLICLFDLFSPQGFRLFSWRDSVRSQSSTPL